MTMTTILDEAIKHYVEVAEGYEQKLKDNPNAICYTSEFFECAECVKEHRQLVEWLSELQRWREFGDWVVKAVLNDDWEDNADFYAEVLCRKLTKLGKLTLKDHKYMEVNADEDSD